MKPNLWKNFNRADVANCHHHFKNGICVTLLFAHVLEVQVGTTTLKEHLNALQEEGAHPLCGVC